MHFSRDERRGSDAGSTRECLTLHATLVGADTDVAGAENLNEINVGTFRRKVGVPPNLLAQRQDHGFVRVRDKQYGVGNASVHRVDQLRTVLQRHLLRQTQSSRCR